MNKLVQTISSDLINLQKALKGFQCSRVTNPENKEFFAENDTDLSSSSDLSHSADFSSSASPTSSGVFVKDQSRINNRDSSFGLDENYETVSELASLPSSLSSPLAMKEVPGKSSINCIPISVSMEFVMVLQKVFKAVLDANEMLNDESFGKLNGDNGDVGAKKVTKVKDLKVKESKNVRNVEAKDNGNALIHLYDQIFYNVLLFIQLAHVSTVELVFDNTGLKALFLMFFQLNEPMLAHVFSKRKLSKSQKQTKHLASLQSSPSSERFFDDINFFSILEYSLAERKRSLVSRFMSSIFSIRKEYDVCDEYLSQFVGISKSFRANYELVDVIVLKLFYWCVYSPSCTDCEANCSHYKLDMKDTVTKKAHYKSSIINCLSALFTHCHSNYRPINEFLIEFSTIVSAFPFKDQLHFVDICCQTPVFINAISQFQSLYGSKLLKLQEFSNINEFDYDSSYQFFNSVNDNMIVDKLSLAILKTFIRFFTNEIDLSISPISFYDLNGRNSGISDTVLQFNRVFSLMNGSERIDKTIEGSYKTFQDFLKAAALQKTLDLIELMEFSITDDKIQSKLRTILFNLNSDYFVSKQSSKDLSSSNQEKSQQSLNRHLKIKGTVVIHSNFKPRPPPLKPVKHSLRKIQSLSSLKNERPSSPIDFFTEIKSKIRNQSITITNQFPKNSMNARTQSKISAILNNIHSAGLSDKMVPIFRINFWIVDFIHWIIECVDEADKLRVTTSKTRLYKAMMISFLSIWIESKAVQIDFELITSLFGKYIAETIKDYVLRSNDSDNEADDSLTDNSMSIDVAANSNRSSNLATSPVKANFPGKTVTGTTKQASESSKCIIETLTSSLSNCSYSVITQWQINSLRSVNQNSSFNSMVSANLDYLIRQNSILKLLEGSWVYCGFTNSNYDQRLCYYIILSPDQKSLMFDKYRLLQRIESSSSETLVELESIKSQEEDCQYVDVADSELSEFFRDFKPNVIDSKTCNKIFINDIDKVDIQEVEFANAPASFTSFAALSPRSASASAAASSTYSVLFSNLLQRRVTKPQKFITINCRSGASLKFVTHNEVQSITWSDGLHLLSNKAQLSHQTESHKQMLLGIRSRAQFGPWNINAHSDMTDVDFEDDAELYDRSTLESLVF